MVTAVGCSPTFPGFESRPPLFLKKNFDIIKFKAYLPFDKKPEMKIHTKYLTINTKTRIDFVNITDDVRKAVQESGIKEGIALVNTMHITSSVFINDNEPGLLQDFRKWLEKLAPMYLDKRYMHNITGEDNAYSHLWRTIMGRETTIAITKNNLDFGPFESIFYAEFDGMRDKRVLVKIIGE